MPTTKGRGDYVTTGDKLTLRDGDNPVSVQAGGNTASITLTLPEEDSDTLVARDSTDTLTNKTLTSPIINGGTITGVDITLGTAKNIAIAGEVAGNADFDGSQNITINAIVENDTIDNANIKADADIARTKLALGSANHVLINDGSGEISSEANLAISRGGTGASDKTAAFDALSPLTSKGDIIVHNGSNNIRLPVGTNNYVLAADNGVTSGVSWKAATDVNSIVVAGSNTQVQYNDNGNLGASSSFTYDASLGKLYLKGINTSSSSYILETRNSADDILFRISNDGGITGKNIAAKSDGVKLGLDAAKNAITTSEYVAIGNNAGKSTTFYNGWTAIGYNAAADCVDATQFTAVGYNASRYLRATEQFVAIGYNAGTFATTPFTNLQYNTNGTFIGSSTKGTDGGSFSTRTVNETVIGYAAIGNGSNTVTIGNSSVTDNYFSGNGTFTGTVDAADVKVDGVSLKNRWQKKTLVNAVTTSGRLSSTTGNGNFKFSSLEEGKHYELKCEIPCAVESITNPFPGVISGSYVADFDLRVEAALVSGTTILGRFTEGFVSNDVDYYVNPVLCFSLVFKVPVNTQSIEIFVGSDISSPFSVFADSAMTLIERNDLTDEVSIW